MGVEDKEYESHVFSVTGAYTARTCVDFAMAIEPMISYAGLKVIKILSILGVDVGMYK